MTASGLARNFDLSEEQFEQLKEQLSQGDETLFRTIFLAHFESCINYLRNEYNLQHERAYDITMDALLLFRRRLLEGKIKYGNLRFLFTQMASHIYLKQVSRSPSQQLKSEVQALLHEEKYALDTDELQLLHKAWNLLGAKCKELLKRFYYHKATLKEIAEEQLKPAGSLRKEKQRCVGKLREHYNKLYQF